MEWELITNIPFLSFFSQFVHSVSTGAAMSLSHLNVRDQTREPILTWVTFISLLLSFICTYKVCIASQSLPTQPQSQINLWHFRCIFELQTSTLHTVQLFFYGMYMYISVHSTDSRAQNKFNFVFGSLMCTKVFLSSFCLPEINGVDKFLCIHFEKCMCTSKRIQMGSA